MYSDTSRVQRSDTGRRNDNERFMRKILQVFQESCFTSPGFPGQENVTVSRVDKLPGGLLKILHTSKPGSKVRKEKTFCII